MLGISAQLTRREKIGFRLHTIYMILEGVILGLLVLNEFIFIKSLKGSNYQMSFLFVFSMAVYIFLVFVNEYLKRIKNKRKLLRWTSLITRIPLLFMLFFPDNEKDLVASGYYHYIFLAIFLVYYFGDMIKNPTINYLLKGNYRHENFGKLYSYSTSVNKIVMLFATFLFGVLLDWDPYFFRYAYAFAAILCVVSLHILSLIPKPSNGEIVEEVKRDRIWVSVKKSFREMRGILSVNKPYLHFQIGFMFYGFSFMISVTIITIFFYEQLNLNYSSVAFYRNAYNILAILLLPFFGRLLGHIDPRRFGIITYSSIAVYIFFLWMTMYFPSNFEVFGIRIYFTMILYILAHGIFAATMSLLWNIGSAYFCRPEQAGTYHSVHLSATGFRALFAPLLGVFFFELFGFEFTFALAIFSLLMAILVMRWSYVRYPRV
ncbi:MAG: MFS transporter [Bacteroidales bacterium]